MHLFLPIAGSSINLLVPFGLGALVGLLSGMFGVGGGFLMTPLLMMVGIPPTVAAATDSCQIAAASASGSYAHARLGNVDYKLGGLMLLGGIGGGAIGVQIIKVLRRMGNADFLIMLTYVVVLGLIGAYMFQESLGALRGKRRVSRRLSTPSHFGRLLARLPWQTDFRKSGIRHSILVPIFLCMLVGLLAAIMGVGGGFIMIPAMVYILRMPMHVAVGTDLFQILFTSSGVTLMQAAVNHTVDFILALVLALGSTVGAQLGARVAKRLRGEQLRIILSVIVLCVCVKMVWGLVATPSLLLSYASGH
ncbi:MAG: sulfite exporter TauE/SafE family protein [Deltaproteobacteria bacterium]|nr:sulfite exporter TauE/SafE family protein [Deltaproteobacteria bacterium]